MQFLRGKALNLLLINFLSCILLAGLFLTPAGGTKPATGKMVKDISPSEAMDFDTCARIAIRQSPFLTKSDLEIQVRRLDEKDSKSAFIPSFNFRTRYYLSNLSQDGMSASRYSLDFVSEAYSPVEAYFSLQVRKIITQIAIQAHLKAISDGLNRLGRMFLEMDSLTQMSQTQTELIKLAGKNINYIQEQLKIGHSNALELKVASQELEMAKIQLNKLSEGLIKSKEGIRAYLNWPADQELRFDLPRSRTQILGNPNIAKDSAETHKVASPDHKIQVLKQELQKYNIILAKTKFLPTLFMGAQTPDPLTLVQSRSLFLFVGANIPVWDGLRRLRNVSRQKIVLKQQEAETNEKEIEFKEKWRTAQQTLIEAASELELSQGQLELAMLKARQQEVRYHNLGEPFSIYLDGERVVSDAKKNIILKTLNYDQAQLNMRNLANDLVINYVNENSVPQRSEEKY